MKNLFPLFLGALCSTSAIGQITLNQSNSPLPQDTVLFTDVTSQVTAPLIGNNMTWDYSSINISGATESVVYTPVVNDSVFPTAQFASTNRFKGLTSFLGYYYDEYRTVDSAGSKWIGIHVPAQAYGLGAISGNSADTLYVLENDINQPENPTYFTSFPDSVGKVSQSIVRYVVNMQLTVNAASLNKAPLQQVFYIHNTDSIVGWGTLKLPLASGYNTNFSVLQSKNIEFAVDSFYLNGSPAPSALLSQFGINQDQITSPKIYRIQFYRQGLYGYQMAFNFTDTTFTSLFGTGGAWVNLSFPLSTGIKSLSPNNEVTVFPNPTDGTGFYISANASTSAKEISLNDLSGRLISRIPVTQSGSNSYVPLNQNLPRGLYLFSVTDRQGKVIGRGKVAVEK